MVCILLFRRVAFLFYEREKMGKYQALVDFILKNIGGKENVLSVTHCMTRLRFTLKNDGLVNEEELLKSSEIMTAQFAAGRYQVVVGTHVEDIFQVLQKTLGVQIKEEKEEKKSPLNSLVDIITKVITPILGILTAAGLLQGILALLTVTKVLDSTDGTYIVLHTMGQTVFYFLPVILGYTSAKAFKLNPYVGMVLGATLVIPELMNNLITEDAMYILFQGTIFETPVYKTFLGIPILFPENGYQNTVIPIIFITFIGSKIEHLLKKIVPDLLAHNLNDFLTILITVPLSILVIGPVTNVLSSLISAFVSNLYTISPAITSVAVALLYQPLVIFGLHWPLSAIGINNLAQMGSDYIFPMSFTANFAQTAVVLAVFLRTKSKEQKTLAVPAMISGVFCIIEPAIYGFSLPVKKRFAFSMLGGAAGALIMSLFSVKMYAFSFGILGFVSFLNPNDPSVQGLIIAIIATIVTMAIAFSLTFFTYKEETPNDPEKKNPSTLLHPESIASPMEGEIRRLEESEDPTFASRTLGNGVVIIPKNGNVYAPVSGRLETVFPDGHAIGIVSENGTEILLHIGINTVEMDGTGYQILAKTGQDVKQGDLLLKADLKRITEAGYSTETVMIVTNTSDYLSITPEIKHRAKAGDNILTVIPFASGEGQSAVAMK